MAKKTTKKRASSSKKKAKPAGRKAKAVKKKAVKKKVAKKKAAPKAKAKAKAKSKADAKPAPKAPRVRTKSPYSRSQLNPLRQALLAIRQRVAGDLDMMGGEALRASDPEVDADEVADLGTDAFERTMTLNLMENDARMLRKIDEALAAMQAGRYGLCAECAQPIPLARLEALPFAGTCVPCQEEQERLS